MNCGANGQNAGDTQWKKLRVPITKAIALEFVRKRVPAARRSSVS
jgi:hypothetical protein